MGGLSFLTKKNFNPANWSNQKAVWEASQKKAQEEKYLQERAEQLKREAEDEQLARSIGGDHGGDQAALKFMYGAPPAAGKQSEEGTTENDQEKLKNSDECETTCKRHPGDDDAAYEFRKLFHVDSKNDVSHNNKKQDFSNRYGADEEVTNIQQDGKNAESSGKEDDTRTALEKAVGRKSTANTGLSLDEQIARFPHLKHAPVAEGMAGTKVNVTFKPLGSTVRNVRCMACGMWGHAKGERECRLSFNPFALSSSNFITVDKDQEKTVTSKENSSIKDTLVRDRNESEVSSSEDFDRKRRSKSSYRKKRKKKHRKSEKRSRHRSRKRSRSRSRSFDSKE